MSENNGLPSGKHTLVEEGTEFKGTLSSKCPIVVMGKVEGEVSGPVIHVTATGVMAGNVKVKDLRSDGEVAGEVEAEAVRISGKVRDGTKIRARTLEVSLIASGKGGMEVVFGECELAVGDEPNKEAAIAAATAPATTPAKPATGERPPLPGVGPAAAAAGRRRGQSETWDDKAEQVDEDGKRRNRGTQPPPT